jgi:hypothetical protein
VNGDGQCTSLDALIVINYLNSSGPQPTSLQALAMPVPELAPTSLVVGSMGIVDATPSNHASYVARSLASPIAGPSSTAFAAPNSFAATAFTAAATDVATLDYLSEEQTIARPASTSIAAEAWEMSVDLDGLLEELTAGALTEEG